jgi:CSLREA domain-containing protein
MHRARVVHSFPRVAMAIAFFLLVSGLTAIAATTAADATPVTTACPSTGVGQLIVRGSVGQIYVVNGGANKNVTITGPGGYSNAQPTDANGALVVRNIPTSGTYSVSIVGDATSPHSVSVTTGTAPPAQDFYTSQTMSIANLGQNKVDGYITTRDCNQLSYRIELPAGSGPYYTVVLYSGYTPSVRPGYVWDQDVFDHFTAAGYAVVGVNMRGSGCSTGAFDLMEQLVALDGYDAIETVAAQSWVKNNKVAMVGASWPGLSQYFVAATQPPSLKAILPGAGVGDFYRDITHPGGIENKGFPVSWAAGRDSDNAKPSGNPSVKAITDGITDPNATPPNPPDDPTCIEHLKSRGQNVNTVAAFHNNPLYNSYWQRLTANVAAITAPTLITDSWQDEQVGSRTGELLKNFSPGVARMVGTNGGHGAYFLQRPWELEQEFLCVQLRGTAPGGCPTSTVNAYNARGPITILLESNAAGVPRTEFSMSSFQMGSEGTAYSLGGDLSADAPDNPPTSSTFSYDPIESNWYQARQDAVTFTGPALDHNVVMAGTGSADFSVTLPSGKTDVDLQVTLSEVRPDGLEMLVQSGWLRASQAALDASKSTPLRPFQAHTASSPLTPNAATPVRVELFPFAHAFRIGSKIRVTINGPGGGSNMFPWAWATKPGGFDVKVTHAGGLVRLPEVTSPVVTPAPGLPPCLDTASQFCRQTLTVDRTNDVVDTNPGDGVCLTTQGGCSLRAAIQEANAAPGGATIRLAPSTTYQLTSSGAGTDTSAIRDLDITDGTMIDGNGATINASQLANRDRVFDVVVPDAQHQAALMLQNTTITGGSTTTESGGGIRAEGCVASSDPNFPICPNVTLIGSTVTGNATIGYGGGIYAGSGVGVSVTKSSTVSNNNALIGGGIAAVNGTTLADSAVTSNAAAWAGGGVYAATIGATNTSFSANTAGTTGGGLQAEDALSLNSSAVAFNTSGANGGGAFIGTPILYPSTIVNSVVIYNTATSPAKGGGVYTQRGVDVSWSTIAGNSAATGANLGTDTSGKFNLTANVLAAAAGGGANCTGTTSTFHSLGRNIASDASCNLNAAGDKPSTDPHLLGFGDLPADSPPGFSPALNAAGTGCPAVDYRGVARPQGAACDMGALERVLP